MDWTELPPERTGVNPRGPARALELVHARGVTAQLCVLRRGAVVLDRAIGCTPDSLFWIYSTSKPFTALLVHLLAERGALDLDDPVAAHWPEFGRHGKEGVTVRQVLQHRAGIPVARSLLRDALAMHDWDRSVRAVEAARPAYPPGEVPAYHISYGFVLGELVRRVTGGSLRDVLTDAFLAPLGLRDTHLGLPEEAWPRHVPMRGNGTSGRIRQAFFNRRALREGVVPSAGISTTARDLARFYQALLDGGELDGTRVLAASTLEQARRPSSDGELDRFLKLPIRWSQGFQLGGPGADPAASHPMGRLSSPLTFGHNGSNTCIAWADPRRELVFVYLTDLISPRHDGALHESAVADALHAACE